MQVNDAGPNDETNKLEVVLPLAEYDTFIRSL